MIKVRELKGYNSYLAMQLFHSLILGLKMLPTYIGETYEEFFERVEKMPPEDQLKLIREAALFVPIKLDELEALICFAEDPNGVAYGPHNIKNLSPDEIYEVIVAVCVEISKIKIDFVTSAEKKSSKISQSIFATYLRKILAFLWPKH